jgi:predicted transcriptional regulator
LRQGITNRLCGHALTAPLIWIKGGAGWHFYHDIENDGNTHCCDGREDVTKEKTMSIGEICNREVVFVNRDTAVQAAAKLMRHYHVGSLVAVDDVAGKRMPVGILTDRDIVMEVDAMELDPKVMTVGDIMSSELITVPESQGVLETMEVMRFKGVRRLPVVGGDGQLVGIVTIDDLLEVLAEELTDLTRIVSKEQTREMQSRK